MATKQCFECARGEHEPDYNADDVLTKYTVRDERGRIYGKGFLCEDHEDALRVDGFKLTEEK